MSVQVPNYFFTPSTEAPQGYFLSGHFSAMIFTSKHTSSLQRHGLFQELTLLEILLAAKVQYATRKDKTPIFSFPCVTCKAVSGTRTMAPGNGLYVGAGCHKSILFKRWKVIPWVFLFNYPSSIISLQG